MTPNKTPDQPGISDMFISSSPDRRSQVDILCVGEALVDLTPAGRSDKGYPLYEMNPGGAPANVAVAARRLGARTAFAGKVGDDPMGEMLRGVLDDEGVDTVGLIAGRGLSTMFSLVQLDRKGDRSFRFSCENRADIQLERGDVDVRRFVSARCLHFGSVSLTAEPARSTVQYAAATAQANGLLVSFDPNYRAKLWETPSKARQVIGELLPCCDVLKLSEEELRLLAPDCGMDAGIERLAARNNIPLIFVTLGPRGCRWYYRGVFGSARAYEVHTVDTTGAGDAFAAAALYGILCREGGFARLTVEGVARVADFACAASSLATAAPGGISAMPDLAEVEQLRRAGSRKYERCDG